MWKEAGAFLRDILSLVDRQVSTQQVTLSLTPPPGSYAAKKATST